MDELTRFAATLVDRLGTRPEGVHRPVSVAEIRSKLLPYRAERRALGLSSVEDYETVLLRLVAEERGFVKTVPPAAAERCREVLAQPTPDLGVLEEIADSTIQVTSLAAAQTVMAEQTSHPERSEGSVPSAALRPQGDSIGHPERSEGNDPCPHCKNRLPSGREAVFCPWCGERLVPLTCERCGTEFESEWRHCITCGAPVQDPLRPR